MAETILRRFKFRRGTAAEWTAANPILLEGEPGLETDTNAIKYGDGVTAWNDLDYFAGSGGGGTELLLVLDGGDASTAGTPAYRLDGGDA